MSQLAEGVLLESLAVEGETQDHVDSQMELGAVVGFLGEAMQDVVLNILTCFDKCIVQYSFYSLVIIHI